MSQYCFKAQMLALLTALLVLIAGCAGGNAGQEDNITQESTTETTRYVDTEPPVLSGIQDHLVYQGESIDFLSGVTATDNDDPAPKLTVDTNSVFLDYPGVYSAVYTATDAEGNEIQGVSTVTVMEWKEGYAPLADVYAAVAKKADQLVTDEMSDREKVTAIYVWARSYISYNNNFAHTDVYQAAYKTLKNYSCDCYGYYAVTKMMMDYLEIPNIDVKKVKNHAQDSNHYWSLVSVDGGQNYYHFDATPRVGTGADFCLVTDAFLDNYSANHKNSHNRDKSLYPATPEA